MKRPPKVQEGRSLRHLTPEQESELGDRWHILIDRETYRRSLAGPVFFASEAERLEAWRIHRERIMAEWDVPFRRPAGWWMERGIQPGVPAAEQRRLILESGELSPVERRAIEAS